MWTAILQHSARQYGSSELLLLSAFVVIPSLGKAGWGFAKLGSQVQRLCGGAFCGRIARWGLHFNMC